MVLLYHLRSARGRRLLFSCFQRRCLIIMIIFFVPVLVSTYLLTGARGAHVHDVWGSGDYGAYWIVAEYLQDNGANIDSYAHQNKYFASDIEDHLNKHARLGCMVCLSFLGTVLSSKSIYHVINPSIVAAIILMLGLAYRWLELERVPKYWLLFPLLLYPYLYFLLYFTYASQATGVLLFVTSLLLIGKTDIAESAQKESTHMVLSGVLAGASVLHYPSILPAVIISMLLLFGTPIRSVTLRNRFLWAAAILFTCGYYLPQIIQELSLVKSGSQLPGWDWRSLIGSLEFTGFRPVLGYDLPEPRSDGLKFLDYAFSFSLLVLLLYGVLLSRLRVATLTVVSTTALLTMAALLKYLNHVPNASHAFVKTLSTFAPWVLIICMLPCARLLVRQKAIHKFFIAIILGELALGQFLSLQYGLSQVPWYTDDLVNLSRRQLQRGYSLHFEPDLHWQMRAPLVSDTRRLLQEGSVTKGPLLIMMRKDRQALLNNPWAIDSEGPYVAVPAEAIRK